ncbi:MAG: RrF2 family transcriptional regulator [Dehalococcoidia bacterium]|nr:RrF2 family transcriptional regulator [Dehalococcoidia bacterium]
MKLSTRARYGTRALLDVALQGQNAPVPLKLIAKRQRISLQYLEQLIAPLIAVGIIWSVRGPGGGISLARRPEEIKLSEVIAALEGPIDPVECVSNPSTCPRSESCSVRELWGELRTAMSGVLESTTLGDLVERHRAREQDEAPMYHI